MSLTYGCEILATPFCCLLACVSIEDGKESLATDATKRHYDGVCILHKSSWPFRLGDCTLEGQERGTTHLVVDGNTMRENNRKISVEKGVLTASHELRRRWLYIERRRSVPRHTGRESSVPSLLKVGDMMGIEFHLEKK